MRLQEYQTYLRAQGIPNDTIDKRMAVVVDLAEFLAGTSSGGLAAGKEEVDNFSRRLIAEGRNTLDNYSALAEYADWTGQRKLYVALLEATDCHNAMAVLADEIEARHGREMRARIFQEALPPLGADEKTRCAHTQIVAQRMNEVISSEDARAAWFQVQHGLPPEFWRASDQADKEKYRQCGNIDAFLTLKRKERDALLTWLRDEGKLWFTVEITDEVLAFIKSDAEMEGGRREGNKVFITKVPYNAVMYLQTNDPKMKRYYACHCPMVREAILHGQPISAEICDCSLGHASHYLAGLDMPIEGEVLESAVKGDTRCRFVFHLPMQGDDADG